ncbi:hypothetical protein ACFVXG_40075 [Kitasatospora sp. NPDC058162]|uniref:hypothetical protein n=1 Tax=Kitasatospora sp. NPDC058162 TaxID=3346362 RepID=UPI0036DD7917
MTNIDNVDLAVQLADLAAEPAPPPGFDPAASITAGRTRLRRRRRAVAAALATATACAVTAVLLLAPGGGGGSDTRLVPAAPPRGKHLTAPATPPPTIGSPTDPLVAGGTFGWLPGGPDAEPTFGYSAADGSVVTRATLPGTAGTLELIVHPDTSEPALRADAQQKQERVPAATVNGRTAYWVTDPTHPTFDSGRRILRWQTASGHWAQLLSNRPRGAEPTDEVLLRVAAAVEVVDQPVPLPFWLSGLPTGTRPTSAELTWPTPGKPWVATLGLTSGEMGFGIIVTPVGSPPYGKTDQKCRTEQGLRICATVESDSLPLTDRLGGLESLAAAVHVTGVEQKTWTTQVIR